MDPEDRPWRRELARELTRRARAPAQEVMNTSISLGGKTRRIGITGPPGAGKSSLIAMLAKQWTAASRKVGIVAIDPTSPLSGGSLLGDRIRMEELGQDPNVFIRSLSSGYACDGLCPNISSLLSAFEQANFDDLVIETVGVGQVSYEARSLVDTFVLVLVPESGDTVQAMKAGILEVADIYVVNKAELPGSARLATELRGAAAWRGKNHGWTAPVILTSAIERRGASELAQVIEAHRNAVMNEEWVRELATTRREFHLRSLIAQHIDEIFASNRAELRNASVADGVRLIIDGLRTADASSP